MNKLEKEILGSLIGLARSTSGNEDLVTNHTLKVIFEAIQHPSKDALSLIEEEKRKLVPNCFYCDNPCGRTSNYEITLPFNKEKELILNNLNKIIYSITHITENEDLYNIIFSSLFYLGEEELDDSIIEEQNNFISTLKDTF